jgi:hypothetical protein
MKSRRQGAILDIVDREPLKSQEQLRQPSGARGLRGDAGHDPRDIANWACEAGRRRARTSAWASPPRIPKSR